MAHSKLLSSFGALNIDANAFPRIHRGVPVAISRLRNVLIRGQRCSHIFVVDDAHRRLVNGDVFSSEKIASRASGKIKKAWYLEILPRGVDGRSDSVAVRIVLGGPPTAVAISWSLSILNSNTGSVLHTKRANQVESAADGKILVRSQEMVWTCPSFIHRYKLLSTDAYFARGSLQISCDIDLCTAGICYLSRNKDDPESVPVGNVFGDMTKVLENGKFADVTFVLSRDPHDGRVIEEISGTDAS